MENFESKIDTTEWSETIKKIVNIVKEFVESVAKVFSEIWEKIKTTFIECLDKNISRKRFIKLLMSRNIQRNTAIELAKNCHRKRGYYSYLDLVLLDGGM